MQKETTGHAIKVGAAYNSLKRGHKLSLGIVHIRDKTSTTTPVTTQVLTSRQQRAHMCNSTIYHHANGEINETLINKMCSDFYPSCKKDTFTSRLRYIFTEEPYFKFNFTIVKKGCMAYVIDIYENNTLVSFNYIPYNKTGEQKIFKRRNLYGVSYRYKVTFLPSGYSISHRVKRSPTKCETFTILTIRKNIKKENPLCNARNDLLDVQITAAPICDYFSNNVADVKNYLKKTKLKISNCTIIPYQLPRDEVDEKGYTNKTLHVVFVMSAILLTIFIILIIVRIVRNIKRKHGEVDRVEGTAEQAGHRQGKKVMILNRPGCELIETLLRDLAFFLKAYGIDVKLSLLEQSQIDAEGGISSYLQRNIDSCDYILIMFTEHDKDHTPLKHRPYEFAVKVISGLAYHQNDSSRYIPLYLTSYEKALSLMPSFLIATQDMGFQIPRELSQLMRRLLGSTVPSKTKEQLVKMNFFINKMKTACKKIECEKHTTCSQDNCNKGTIYDSVSNLSAIWASTAPSRWSSFHSIYKRPQVDVPLLTMEEILKRNEITN
ncbi:uncharacterized protein LOC130655397 isoform X2 [Hydractinia symbiolongicarpus]|nr:uncharacterized protein LOC130655397 isoform X2 [Hydractinia symbiolongicarpus]